MTRKDLDALLRTPGVIRHPPLDTSRLDELPAEQGFSLPEAHKQVLAHSNGLEVYWGYFRLYGLHATDTIDAIIWNNPEYWKFAWNDRCAKYWCFGGTAWGDQYAYSCEDVKRGKHQVWLLDALTMSAEELASSFEEFFHDEIMHCAETPYDEMIVRAKEVHGAIAADSHLAYVPSPLISGSENVENAMIMSARVAMIINGDIAVQMDALEGKATLKRFDNYEDEEGRTRIRLVWA